MSGHKIQDVERLFYQVADLPASKQLEHLEAACEDPTLRAEVIKLLEFDQLAVHRTNEDGEVAEAQPELVEGSGNRIGPYKLLQQIGEGGMGVVYMAQQDKPIRRRVALKVIKPGMDTRQIVARFEAERQAMAMMDHPNIARLLDAGVTDSQRPYFVMELVQGLPITDFCRQQELSVRERLELFLPVCQAIQSAHQKGIIHRDVKPNNILVTLDHGEPMAVVIDFGIAKALDQELTDKTYFTHFAMMVGTPAYMSPEQAGMSRTDVDVRSDIYSLGAVLYELLTGTTPFDEEKLRSGGLSEMCRIITEEQPEKPSSRLQRLTSTSAADGRASPPARTIPSDRRLSKELDWITLKCLEKDQRRRYDTAHELAADLHRYLNNEPVSAAAPSLGYQVQKFYARHRGVTLLALTAVAAVLLGAIGVVWQWWDAVAARAEMQFERNAARHAKDEADRARRDAEAALYRSNIARALLELEANNVANAADLLQRCPESLRGWEWRVLQGWIQSDLFTMQGHTSWVFDVAYSPDGRTIASCGGGDPFWQAHGWKSGPGEIILWDANTGRKLCELGGPEPGDRHNHVIHAIAFSPDSSRLASASQDGSVRLWDVETGKFIRCFQVPDQEGVTSVAFSPDGRFLAAAGFFGGCWVWNRESWELERELQGHGGNIYGLAFDSAGARLIASSYSDGIDHGPDLRIWDLATGDMLPVEGPSDFEGKPLAVDPSHGKLVLPRVNVLQVRDLNSGRILRTVEEPGGAWIRGLDFHASGRAMASCGDSGIVRIWNTKTWKSAELVGHAGRVNAVAFAPDGARVVSGGQDGAVRIWDLAHSPKESSLPLPSFFRWKACAALHFHPDERTLSIVHSAGHVLDVDVETHSPLAHSKFNLNERGHQRAELARVSGDGNWLVGIPGGISDHERPLVQCWSLRTPQPAVELRHELGTVVSLTTNHTASRIATAIALQDENRQLVTVWDRLSGEILFQRSLPGFTVTRLALDQPGDRLAIAATKDFGSPERDDFVSHIDVIDLQAGKETHRLTSRADRWYGLQFSPDGASLAAADRRDRTVLNWKLESDERIMTQHGPQNAMELAFSPDGTRLAVASRELTKIIDAESCEDLLELRTRWQQTPDTSAFYPHVCWSSDGRDLAVGSATFDISVWSSRPTASLDPVSRDRLAKRRRLAQQLCGAHQLCGWGQLDAARATIQPYEDVELHTALEYKMRADILRRLGNSAAADKDDARAIKLGLQPNLLQ